MKVEGSNSSSRCPSTANQGRTRSTMVVVTLAMEAVMGSSMSWLRVWLSWQSILRRSTSIEARSWSLKVGKGNRNLNKSSNILSLRCSRAESTPSPSSQKESSWKTHLILPPPKSHRNNPIKSTWRDCKIMCCQPSGRPTRRAIISSSKWLIDLRRSREWNEVKDSIRWERAKMMSRNILEITPTLTRNWIEVLTLSIKRKWNSWSTSWSDRTATTSS